MNWNKHFEDFKNYEKKLCKGASTSGNEVLAPEQMLNETYTTLANVHMSQKGRSTHIGYHHQQKDPELEDA